MDIATTQTGDILKNDNGVIQLSIADSIGQRIDHILRSKPGDWARQPGMGAYVPQYVGYPNVPATKVLIEDEVSEALQNDEIVGVFPVDVEYTPTARDSGMLEITVYLPDGNNLSIYRDLGNKIGINTTSSLPYTPPQYDTTTEVTRTEIVEIEQTTNVFEIEYLPINSNILIIDEEDAEYDTEGNISVSYNSFDYTYTFVSGALPIGAVSDRLYDLQPSVLDIIDNKQVDTIEINVDGTDLNDNDYIITNETLSIKEENTQIVDGTVETYGVETAPSGYVTITLNYYDAYPIISVDSFEQDYTPDTLYPRSRITDRTYVTARKFFSPGAYVIQYLSYATEVENA